MKDQDVKLMYLIMYLKLMLLRFFLKKNNMKLYIPLNASTLNTDHKFDSINLI